MTAAVTHAEALPVAILSAGVGTRRLEFVLLFESFPAWCLALPQNAKHHGPLESLEGGHPRKEVYREENCI